MALQDIINTAIAQSGGPRGSFITPQQAKFKPAPAQAPAPSPVSTPAPVAPTPTVPPAPVDISSFTPDQQAAFNRANALGSGVPIVGAPTTVQPTPDPLNVPVPNAVPDTTITADEDPFDLQRQLQGFFTQQQALQQQIIDASQPSPEILALRDQIRTLNQQEAIETERAENRLAPTFAITGEQAAIARQGAIQRQALTNQLEALTDQQSVQLDALTKVYQFSQDNLEAFRGLSELTNPEIQQTFTNPNTGEITAILRDPLTGGFSQQIIGQITPEIAGLNFIESGTFTNKNTGQVNFWGLTQDGELVSQVIGNAGVSGDSTGDGQIGISPITGKAFTDSQSKAAAFASRIQDAEPILSQGKPLSIPGVPSFLRSQERRAFEQAERNFITAVLRRESGAAIADSEFESAREVYIPLSTDSENVLAQKARARQTILQGLKNESVGAFDQLQSSLNQGFDPSVFFD